MSGIVRRLARPGDAPAIRALVTDAFGGRTEADLVEALDADGDLVLSLVAERDGGILGHVAFSRLRVEAGPALAAACLAPIAVAETARGVGIGAALVREGLARLAAAGEDLVLVLGDPAWYGRFGFRPIDPAVMTTPYPFPENQYLRLGGGRIETPIRLAYAAAFARLG